ncbi:hypothetical protein ABNG30_32465 [Bacillus thuringiensis]
MKQVIMIDFTKEISVLHFEEPQKYKRSARYRFYTTTSMEYSFAQGRVGKKTQKQVFLK